MPSIPENHIIEFLRKLDTIPFLENVLREQIPALIDTWDVIGKCLSVGGSDDAGNRSNCFFARLQRC